MMKQWLRIVALITILVSFLALQSEARKQQGCLGDDGNIYKKKAKIDAGECYNEKCGKKDNTYLWIKKLKKNECCEYGDLVLPNGSGRLVNEVMVSCLNGNIKEVIADSIPAENFSANETSNNRIDESKIKVDPNGTITEPEGFLKRGAKKGRGGWRSKGAVAGALIDAGAQLLLNAPGGTNINVWQYGGRYIIEEECWEDGSGACPNGNCLDYDGRRGVTIKETSWKCSWYCIFAGRDRCRYQICCPFTRYEDLDACATLYQHCNYDGSKFTMNNGDVKYDLTTHGGWNDQISSFRVKAGCRLYYGWHTYFSGGYDSTTSSDSCLVDNGLNDQISSLYCVC